MLFSCFNIFCYYVIQTTFYRYSVLVHLRMRFNWFQSYSNIHQVRESLRYRHAPIHSSTSYENPINSFRMEKNYHHCSTLQKMVCTSVQSSVHDSFTHFQIFHFNKKSFLRWCFFSRSFRIKNST